MACATICGLVGCFCLSGVDMVLVCSQGYFTCDCSGNCWCLVFPEVSAIECPRGSWPMT